MASAQRTTPSRSSPLSEIERGGARYLFAVSILSDDDRVRTGELQSYLDVAPASVTEMLAKLDDRGLVEYEKYHGATLTRRGDAIATELARRYCVVSTFFDSELGTDLDERTAFDIAFALPADGMGTLRERVRASCLGLCPDAGTRSEDCSSC